MTSTVCLNMIVKNEAHVIRRCIDSVRPFIDQWVIVDTGSTDGTQDLIRGLLGDLPGELHERPWRSFGHNRTEAIELARGKSDYLMFMDADNIFRSPDSWHWPELTADAYQLLHHSGGIEYMQCILVADRLRWRYVGVLHEYVMSDPPSHTERLFGAWIDRRHEGARSRDPEVFTKDAALLESAMVGEPDNRRYAFYLAQSYRDARVPEKARAAYLRRAQMGGWNEEVWYSLYQAALLDETLNRDPATIVHGYLLAYQHRQQRAEPLYQLARFHRERGQNALAYLFAKQAAAIPRPPDELFIDDAIYRWRSLDELGSVAYYVGAFAEGRQALERLLIEGQVPVSHRQRIVENLRCYSGGTMASQCYSTNSKINYSIYIVTLPGYLHSRAFEEIAIGLQSGFAELGEVVPIVHDPREIIGRGVVLGANLLPTAPHLRIPDNAIVFNLEQASLTSGWLNDTYLDVLRTHDVWDYSEYNIDMLRALGVQRIRLCRIGYASCLTRIAHTSPEDVDILFYGSISGRRIPILDAIAATGLRVHRLFGVYGAERDRWIARSKVVLNLHAHPERIFEIVRVSYLLANRRCVVSESGRGSDRIEAALREGVAFGDTAELPELCRRYAADATGRTALARRGFELFSAMRQSDSLQAALDNTNR